MTCSQVTFSVRVPLERTSNGNVVFVVGNIAQLGDFLPSKAIALTKHVPTKECQSDAIWSAIVDITDIPKTFDWYLFFIGEPSATGGAISVRSYEYKKYPRVLDFEHCPSPSKSPRGRTTHVIHLSEEPNKISTHRSRADIDFEDVCVYGCDDYFDLSRVGRGWLSENQYEVRVSLHGGEAVRIYEQDKPRDGRYYLDCVPLYLDQSPLSCSSATAQRIDNVPPTQCDNEVLFVKFGGDQQMKDYCTLKEGGVLLGDDEILTLSVITHRPSKLLLKFIVKTGGAESERGGAESERGGAESERSGAESESGGAEGERGEAEGERSSKDCGQVLGSAVVSVAINSTRPDPQHALITGSDTARQPIIGHLTYSLLCITPSPSTRLNSTTFFTGLQYNNILIGHRGMGSSFSNGHSTARLRENTLASFAEASSHGVDMVHLDVVFSKDCVPVVYQDFITTVRTTRIDHHENTLDCSVPVPVQEFTFDQLTYLNLCSVAEDNYHTASVAGLTWGFPLQGYIPTRLSLYRGIELYDTDRAFPSLRACFESTDIQTGFYVEVKYPMRVSSGRFEDDLVPSVGRNEYVDAILAVAFDCVGAAAGRHERQIVFSSLDPDVCVLLQAKQGRFSVLFRTLGENKMYADARTRSLAAAIQFAHAESLAGIDVPSKVVLADLSVTQEIIGDLYLFCSGEESNNKDNIEKLRGAHVDWIVIDRCDEFNRDRVD